MMFNCAKIVDFNQVEKSIKWIPSDMHDINFQSVINHSRFFSYVLKIRRTLISLIIVRKLY